MDLYKKTGCNNVMFEAPALKMARTLVRRIKTGSPELLSDGLLLVKGTGGTQNQRGEKLPLGATNVITGLKCNNL